MGIKNNVVWVENDKKIIFFITMNWIETKKNTIEKMENPCRSKAINLNEIDAMGFSHFIYTKSDISNIIGIFS